MDKLTIKETKTILNIKQIGSAGPKGDDGDQGLSATINIGTVNTVDYTQPATVENVGTENEAIFNFNIPKGLPGESGAEFSNVGTGLGIWKETVDSIARLKSLLSLSDIIVLNQDNTEETITVDINTRALNNLINDSLQGINEELVLIEENITTITNNVTDTQDNITNINQEIGFLNTSINDFNTSLNNLYTSVNGNINSIIGIQNNITTINTNINNINNAITTLQNQMTTANTNITALQGKVLPTGGTAGQVLVKTDATDYHASWQTPTSGGSPSDFDNYITGSVIAYTASFGAIGPGGVTIVNSGQNAYGKDSSTYPVNSFVAGKNLFYMTPKTYFKQTTSGYCSYVCGYLCYNLSPDAIGFRFTRKFGFQTNNNPTSYFFTGMTTASVALNAMDAIQGNVSNMNIGLGFDATDTNYNLVMNIQGAISTPIKVPLSSFTGNLQPSDYLARQIETVYSFTMDYNPLISPNYIKCTFCNLSTGRSGTYNWLFSNMKTFTRSGTTNMFQSVQAMRFSDPGNPEFMVFFSDIYRLYMPNLQ